MGIVVRQSIKGTIMNYLGVLVGFITTFFIVTKYLTTEEVGLTRVLVDASILLSSLAQLGTSTSAMRYYPHFKDEKEKGACKTARPDSISFELCFVLLEYSKHIIKGCK